MRIYRPKFTPKKARNGKTKKTHYSRWYIDFTDHNGQRRRLPGFEDKAVTTDFAQKVQALINRHQSGTAIDDSPELIDWMSKLPDDTTRKLVQWGLIPRQRGEALKPITEHLEDYIAYLAGKGRSADYVNRMRARVKTVCDGCRWHSFKQITPAKMEAFLRHLETLNYSATSRNHYGDAMKTFLNWCVTREGGNRISGNPLADIKKEQRDSERKGVLTPEQFLTLVQATVESNTTIGGVNGRERGVMYLLAGSTGLRRLELLSLLWGDLRLNDEQPYVLARAAITKNKKESRLPLPASVAEVMSQFREYRQTTDKDYVFSFGGRWVNTAGWIRADLKAASLPLIDREGNKIYFHSLRNSFVSFLVNSNTPMKVAQKLARHSDPKLTYNTYARAFEENEQAAVKMLPNIGAFCVATSVAKSSEKGRTTAVNIWQHDPDFDQKTAFLAQKPMTPRGFEPLLPG